MSNQQHDPDKVGWLKCLAGASPIRWHHLKRQAHKTSELSVSHRAKSFIVTSETIETISLGLEADSQQPNVTVSIGSCRMETKAD